MGTAAGECEKRAKKDFEVGGWHARPSANQISRQGVTQRLRRQLMDLLVLLAERAGEVVTKDEILQEVWQGRFVTELVLPRFIAELWESLGDEAARMPGP